LESFSDRFDTGICETFHFNIGTDFDGFRGESTGDDRTEVGEDVLGDVEGREDGVRLADSQYELAGVESDVWLG